MKKIEIISVLLLSLTFGFFVALEWNSLLLKSISSGLFGLFLPGIMLVTFLTGGFHQASEVHVVFGVTLQFFLSWWFVKALYKKIKSINRD